MTIRKSKKDSKSATGHLKVVEPSKLVSELTLMGPSHLVDLVKFAVFKITA